MNSLGYLHSADSEILPDRRDGDERKSSRRASETPWP